MKKRLILATALFSFGAGGLPTAQPSQLIGFNNAE